MALPIAAQLVPAFGLLPDIAWGLARHQGASRESSIPDYQPPTHLRHLHDPWFFARLWERVLAHVRNPVRVHQDDSGVCLVEVLGDVVIELAADGQLHVQMWDVRRIGQPELVKVNPAAIVLQGMPWRRLWLQAMAAPAALEVEHWAKNFMPERAQGATLDEARAYATWAFECFGRQIRRHCDLGVMRRRIATALRLDPWAKRIAFRSTGGRHLPSASRVSDYNLVMRHRAAFESLDREAPGMVPFFGLFCEQVGFPRTGEPMARLKGFLRERGISHQTWRQIVQDDARLLTQVKTFYDGELAGATLDCLRCLQRVGVPPTRRNWLLREFLSQWGHAGQLREKYITYFVEARVSYRHIARAFLREYGPVDVPSPEMLAELSLVLRWERDAATVPAPDKLQRRAGWAWLLRRAMAWHDEQAQRLQLNPTRWAVPFESLQWHDLQVMALVDELALWEEAHAMQHCANRLADECRKGEHLVLSVRQEGRRLCTLGLTRKSDAWVFWQAVGRANTVLAPGLAKSLQGLVAFINQQ